MTFLDDRKACKWPLRSTLPVDIRRKFGLQKSASTDHIEEMDRLLKEHGLTFQDLIDQMRDERPNLVNWDQESDPALQHE